MLDPIPNTVPAASSFSLASAVNGTRMGGKFQQIGNSDRSDAVGTPLAHAAGEYFKQCSGAALSVARDVMAEVRDVPGKKESHVAALNKSIAWATPGAGQLYDQIVLHRLTILGSVHAGLSELLDQTPGDEHLNSLRDSVKNAIGKIAELGGKGSLPEPGTFKAGSKTSDRFTDVLNEAKSCVVKSMQKVGGPTLLDAIGRAVVAGPLLRSIQARNPQMHARLIQDSSSQLDLMQALSRTWSDKLQGDIADLLNSGGYHHIATAITQLLNIPDLVLQPTRGNPSPADKARPPEPPPGIPQPMLDRAGTGGLFYNYSPNTTELHMEGFLKELFGQLKEFGGGGFKGSELLDMFNLMNDQFAASRDMLIEHGRLQERVQNQLNINKAQNNELQSAFDTIRDLNERLNERDAAVKQFAGRGHRRDSDRESVLNLSNEIDVGIKDDAVRGESAFVVQKNEDLLVSRSSEPDIGEPVAENEGGDPSIDPDEDPDVEFVDQDTKDVVDTLREGVNLRFCTELRVNGQGGSAALNETPGIASDDPRPIQNERNVTSGRTEFQSHLAQQTTVDPPAKSVEDRGAMFSSSYIDETPPPPSSRLFHRESLVKRNGAASLSPPSTLVSTNSTATPKLEYAQYLEARNKSKSERLMLDASTGGSVENFSQWRGAPIDSGASAGTVMVQDMTAFFRSESLDASEMRVQPSIARGLGLGNMQLAMVEGGAARTVSGRGEQLQNGAKLLSDLEKLMQFRANGDSISQALEKSGAGKAIGGMAQARSQAKRLEAMVRKNDSDSAESMAISQNERAGNLLDVPDLTSLPPPELADVNSDLQARLDALRDRSVLPEGDDRIPVFPPSTTGVPPSSNEKHQVATKKDPAGDMLANFLSDIKATKLKPTVPMWRDSLGQGWRDMKSAQ